MVLRHFFAIGPALGCFVILFGLFMGPNLGRGTGPVTPAEIAGHRQGASQGLNPVRVIFLLWGEVGALYFFVDSIRRNYRGNRAVALAFTVMGLFSVGAMSMVYYVIWGRHSLEAEGDVYGNAFCEHCLATTSDSAAPSAMAHELVLGTRYMGSSDRCEQCNSVVRTLWAWVILPLYPVGTYRIIPTDTYHFIGRRTALKWEHVTAVYGIALTAVGAVLILCLTYR